MERFKIRNQEVEVIRRRSKRKLERPLFGGPESVLGQSVQKDLDDMVLGDILHAMEVEKTKK